jgi:hypothetical protein
VAAPCSRPGQEGIRILRIESVQPGSPIERDEPITIEVDGVPLLAHAGETIATVILASGRQALRWTRKGQRPRALYCGIGVCFDCLLKPRDAAACAPARPLLLQVCG